MNYRRLLIRSLILLPIICIIGADAAMASTGSSAWTTPLDNLTKMLTGTPTKVISIVAIVVAGIALIFGEDLGAFAKRLLMVVIATALIVGSSSIVGGLAFTFSSGTLLP